MFRELELSSVYNSEKDNVAERFYNPVLKSAVTFDRVSAYFSAKALALYSQGLEYFGRNGNQYRLIISKDISEEDYNEIIKGYNIKSNIADELRMEMIENLSITEERELSNLAYLISLGIVHIKIAFKKKGIFHDKCGIVKDSRGDIICFRGSNNETEAAIVNNYESFQVTCSWLDCNGFYASGIEENCREFEKLWNNQHDNIIVLPAHEVVIKEILKYNKGELIVEDILLKENAVILDYDERLKMYINTSSIDWLLNSPIYKLHLKRYVDIISGQSILFKKDLSYLDFIKIAEKMSIKIPQKKIAFHQTKRLLDYIDERNIYIEKRAKLGIELKTDDRYLDDRFQKFSEIVNQNMSRKLREKQMKDAFFMYAMTKSANFSVPGSGKTSSVLGVYAFLYAHKMVDKIIMIGPKNAFGSWIDEFNICFKSKQELKCFNIQSTEYKSVLQKKRALQYDSGNCNLFLFNYECIGTYEEEIIKLVSKNAILVFDEVHKVKRVGGEYSAHALKIARYAPYIVAMTGTPIPNSYLDLYNLLHILYNDEYREFFGFDTTMLKNPSMQEVDNINKKIQPFFCRTSKQQLSVPDANADCIIKITCNNTEQRIFEIISKKYQKNKLALFIRILQLESNPHMLLDTLDLNEFSSVLDITDDIDTIDYADYSKEFEDLINSIEITSKKKACIKKIQELVNANKKVIVWCIFKDSIRSLEEILKSEGIKTKSIYGEVELNDRLRFIDEYKNGEFDVLITNPHTLAESVSLHSVCHDAIYFEYSYNLVHLLQSKDRIHRLGLPENQYTQYYYLQDTFTVCNKEFSMDNKIYERLKEKENIMIKAIDNNILESVYTTEEDLDVIFGDII